MELLQWCFGGSQPSRYTKSLEPLKRDEQGSTLISRVKKAIVYMICTVTVIVLLKTALQWELSGLWLSGRAVLTSAWGAVYRASGENDFVMLIVFATVAQNIVFAVVNSFFAFIDLTGKPAFLVRYKIQEAKSVPVNWEMYRKTLLRTAFNSVVVSIVFQLTAYPLYLMRGLHCGYELPSFRTVVANLFVCMVVIEIAFFYGHWLFHYPPLYKLIHKTHHEWTAPVGIASIYCHPVEHYFVNLLPVAAGPLIAGAHLSVGMLWFSLVIVSTTINHSGYHFPFFPSPEWHDFHHAKFNQCFGVFGVLDYLHNTDQKFRMSKAYERHRLLLGLKPANQVYPENKINKKNQ